MPQIYGREATGQQFRSVVAVVGVLVTAGDGQHPEAQHLGERMDDLRRIALVPDATGQKIGQAKATFRLAQQHQTAVRGDQATIEGRRHFLAMDRWKIEGMKGIVGHGGCGAFVAWQESRLSNKSLHDYNELRYIRRLNSRRGVNNPG
jgi:hypothetical protein